MIWASWSEFWAMGGRGFFVWGAYGVSALLIVFECLLLARRQKETWRRLIRLQKLEQDQGH